MVYLSIALKGLKRFDLPGFSVLELDFTSLIQIFIGTNGSGKTSLMQQISPLPALSTDFDPEGYKVIRIADKQDYYILGSYFEKTTRHSFLKNNEELNVSGKETEQRKLVKDHFGITPQLHKLLTGEIQFSSLSSIQRRDWIMAVSGMDFEYVMGYYQRVKDYQKEQGILVKSMSEHQDEENSKLTRIGNVEPLRERAKELKEIITSIMQQVDLKQPLHAGEIELKAKARLMAIQEKSHTIIRELPRSEVGYFNHVASLEDLKVHGGVLRAESSRLKEELSLLYKKKEDLVRIAEERQVNGFDRTVEIDVIAQLNTSLHAMEESHQPFFLKLDCDYHCDALEQFELKAFLMAEVYFNYVELQFSRDKTESYKSQHQVLSTELAKLRNAEQTGLHEIRHLEGIPYLNCPSCQFEFKADNAELRLVEIQLEVSQHGAEIEKLTNQLNAVNELLDQHKEFILSRQAFLNVFDEFAHPAISVLKKSFLEIEKDGIGKRRIYDLLTEWKEGLELSARYKETKQSVEAKEFALKHLMELESLQQRYEWTQVDDVDHQLNLTLVNIDRCSMDLRRAAELYTKLEHHVQLLKESMEEYQRLQGDIDLYSRAKAQEIAKTILSAAQSELAALETSISEVSVIEQNLQNITRYRQEHELELQASKILTELVSPNTGLIAEYLLPFMEEFVEDINTLVRRVWEYEMVVLPCKLDSETIDYRFPVKLSNSRKPKKDITETSKGQNEFLNLIFRIVIAQSVGLTTYPLYLDEVGETFDEQHSENYVRFVNNCLEHGDASQIFMISHNYAGHASFVNAEVFVVDEKNVLNKPSRYNEHARIVYQ